jgi:glyoxylase-like metal-dependent hydrolase (beta-lactamase superfamily II)
MALEFNRDFAARAGEAVVIAPGIRRITAPNPGPFTFHGTNTHLIGEGSIAVIDPGPDDPRHLDALVEAIGSAKVAHILVTHTHRDHSPGARPLQQRVGGTILAAGPHRLARAPRPGEEIMVDASGDRDFVPDAALADSQVIEGANYRLQAVATPGHTSNHLAFAVLGTSILFPGDHVMGWSTTVVAPPDGSMRDYMASLDRLLDREEKLYLPAHGAPVGEARAYVRALRSHRRMREAAILEGLRRGDRTIPEFVARNYQDLDPRLRGAAGLSTLAHVEDLVERGIVVAEEPPTLDGRYWLTDSGSG